MIDRAPAAADRARAAEPHVPWELIGTADESPDPQREDDALSPIGERARADDLADDSPHARRQPEALDEEREAPDAELRALEKPVALPTRGGGWTLPLLCAGLAIVACCVVIPQADANRRLAYEKMMLQLDLASIQHQVAVNQQFLKKVADDPTLAERLAERQMKVLPEGTRVLELKNQPDGGATMSPFQLVTVAPPPPLPPYQPVGGTIAHLCYDPQTRLYLIGAALGMIAAGLVLGYAPQK